MGIDPRARGGAAERDLADSPQRVAHPHAAEADLGGVAGELLAERHRHRIHQVGAPGLDVSANSSAFAASAASRPSIAGSRSSLTSPSAARWTADGKTSLEDWPQLTWSLGWILLAGEVGDHLVGVHVRRGPGAGLEDVDRELVVVLTGSDRVARGADPLGYLGVEFAQLGVDPG